MKVTLLNLFLVIFLASEASAYTFNIGNSGSRIRWSDQNLSQTLFFNRSNSSAITDSEASTIAALSASQWNSNSKTSLSISTTTGGESSTRNDLYFSNNSLFFSGTGVLAVTQVSSRIDNGNIIEADIIFNNAVAFSSTPSHFLNPYFGDVLTHEIGHFLGMEHSQVANSTMFYAEKYGQESLHTDDIAGVKNLYSTSYNGTISGSVIGGKSSIGVFAAHVQAISTLSGSVIASAISSSNGSFSITGLPLNDTYYLYVEPLKDLSTLPAYYVDTRVDFCSGGQSYRGSFFQSCYKSESGHAQGIELTSSTSSVNVGSLTIRCGLDVPQDYINNKGSTFALSSYDSATSIGNSFTGYFSASEASSSTADVVTVDLSSVDPSPGNLYLDVKTISQSLNSKVQIDITISSPAFAATTYSVTTDSDGNPNMDIFSRIPLDLTAGNNVFTVTLTPQAFDDYLPGSGYSGEAAFFPADESFDDSMNFYLFIANVSQLNSGAYELYSYKDYTVSDNSSCTDAPRTYAVSGRAETVDPLLDALAKRKSESQNSLACGTVDMDGGGNGPYGGMFTLLLGVVLAMIPLKLRESKYLG